MSWCDLLCEHPWYTFIVLVLLYNAIFPIGKKTLPKGAVILVTGGAGWPAMVLCGVAGAATVSC